MSRITDIWLARVVVERAAATLGRDAEPWRYGYMMRPEDRSPYLTRHDSLVVTAKPSGHRFRRCNPLC